MALSTLGERHAAINCFDKCLKINPNNFNAYYHKGSALDDLGEKQAAIKCYENCLKI